MTDLWTEASYDHDEMARTAALARVQAELQDVMPFLLMARTEPEYRHRRALAEERLETIALRYGVDPAEVMEVADRQFALYHEAAMQRLALPEGECPTEWITSAPAGQGGPEKPLEHDESVDYSHGYSEIPQGAPGGPSPAVTRPTETKPAQVQEATAAKRCTCGRKTTDGECGPCGKKPGSCTCNPKKAGSLTRTAQGDGSGGGDYLSTMPPDTGTGAGSLDTGTGAMSSTLPASVPAGNSSPITPPDIGQVTSSVDPVHQQIRAVASSIAAANPGLAESECRRVARQVVGRYLTADLTSDQLTRSQISGDPGPADSGGSGGSSGGGGGVIQHGLEWQGLKSLLPGGEGAAAGEAAGGAGAAADLAELAPLALA